MCLIVLAWQTHPDYPLIVAANRDEFFARPTTAAYNWDSPNIIAGRDLVGGGTWLGVTKNSRFAAITNIRAPNTNNPNAPTRGKIVTDALTSTLNPQQSLRNLTTNSAEYNGFNMLLSDGKTMAYCNNIDNKIQILPAGVYGVSNASLDTPWDKLTRARNKLQSVIQTKPDVEALFNMLADKQLSTDEYLPNTGVPLDVERMLSAIFVSSKDYGTRSSSVLLFDNKGGVYFEERTFDANAHESRKVKHIIGKN